MSQQVYDPKVIKIFNNLNQPNAWLELAFGNFDEQYYKDDFPADVLLILKELTRSKIFWLLAYRIQGLQIEQCCSMSGISRETVRVWKKEGDEYYKPEFAQAWERATAGFEVFHMSNMTRHSKKDWRASWSLLQALKSDRYKPPERTKHDFENSPFAQPSLFEIIVSDGKKEDKNVETSDGGVGDAKRSD